ncbi:MAG: LCP family protein [Ruminococcus sp.]|nr:LCP family protein [Ruminococcus sp.]
MAENEIRDGSKENASGSTPKPLRKLTKVSPQQPQGGERKPKPLKKLEPLKPAGQPAAPEQRTAPKDVKGSGKRQRTVQQPSAPRGADFLVKFTSIIATLLIVAGMTLNMPILRYKDADSNISIMRMFKEWQPLNMEGDLEQNTMDLQINSDVVIKDYTDGLDLPQLIEGQYSVLLLGFDEEEFNTDVMWVLEFDIGHGKLNILQIPRDCCLPDYTTSPTGKINSVYAMGKNYNLTPIQKVVNAVQENFGIPIDAYITTACFDIVDIVDLIGGIPITIDNEIMYEADKIIPEGDITLTGEQAEWFIRFRREWMEGDIGRMQNQRRFMAAAMNKLQSIVQDEGRIKLYGYLKQIYDRELLYTNLRLEDIGMIADFASTLSMDDVLVNMVPGEGAKYPAPDGEIYDVYSVHKQKTLDMLNQYYRPYQNNLKNTDSTIQELITDYVYDAYDDTGATLDEIEDSTEPERNPAKAPR